MLAAAANSVVTEEFCCFFFIVATPWLVGQPNMSLRQVKVERRRHSSRPFGALRVF